MRALALSAGRNVLGSNPVHFGRVSTIEEAAVSRARGRRFTDGGTAARLSHWGVRAGGGGAVAIDDVEAVGAGGDDVSDELST